MLRIRVATCLPSDAWSMLIIPRVLRLSGCPLRELPADLTPLQQLQLLDLSGCSALTSLPDDVEDMVWARGGQSNG